MSIITDDQRRKTKLLFGARMEKARSFQELIHKPVKAKVRNDIGE